MLFVSGSGYQQPEVPATSKTKVKDRLVPPPGAPLPSTRTPLFTPVAPLLPALTTSGNPVAPLLPAFTPLATPVAPIPPALTSITALSAQHRPTTGGKQLSKETLEAYLESLREDISSVSENEEETVEPETVPTVRRESPICEVDQCHWAYQVWRKGWTNEEDREDSEWYVCGHKVVYTSLDAANTAAGREILYERDGLAMNSDARSWSRTLDMHDMAQYLVEFDSGGIEVKVDRFLRNRRSGQLPTSKAGWLRKIGWDIMRKTTSRAPHLSEDCFEEVTDPTSNAQVDIEVVDGVYTIMDEANRQAGDVILDLYCKKDCPRLNDQIKRSVEQKRLHELLDVLETQDEPFHESFVRDEDVTIEIYVQEREIKGPRNI
jgi:hypothetical protein